MENENNETTNTELSNKYKFKDFCKILENVSNSKAAALKTNVLLKFFTTYRQKHAYLHNNTSANLYPLVRLILPHLERERGPYGMKEKGFTKAIMSMLCLDKTSPFAIELLKSSSSSHMGFSSSNFSNVVYKGLKDRFYTDSDLSIAEINKYLDQIAEYHANNNAKAKEDILFKLIKQMSAFEQKWIIRIILKETRLGIGQDNILKCVHQDAVKLFESNSNLSKTCEKLIDPKVRLHEISISLFDAFNPMLSQKCDKKQFNKAFRGDAAFIVENKFDGERFQLHMKNGKFQYFSRRGFQFSKEFGTDYSNGLFTPLLRNRFANNVKSVILDGEMMGWNTKTKQFGSKGMNFDVKKLTESNTLQPCFCVFDVVYLNDKVITGQTLNERKDLLKSIIKEQEGIIIVSKYTTITGKEELLNIFNKSVDDKEEGIVFKDVNSIYVPNDRNGGWWKMKLEFFEGVMSDLDLLIMGGYFGQGRHRNKVAGFLLGVGEHNDAGVPKKFLSMDKVNLGLSDVELDQLDQQIGKYFQKVDGSNAHEKYGLLWGKEVPDVWIQPNKSCLLQVRSSELVRNFGTNTKCLANYSLRFARIQKIRDDKPYYDCLTTKQLEELTSSSGPIAKLDKRHLELADLTEDAQLRDTKRRKKNTYVVKYDDVDENSDLLGGRRFVVLTGEGAWNKLKVEQAIRENGGVVEQTNGPKTYCLLVGDPHLRTSTYKGDIVYLSWLRNILNEGTFEEYKPSDMISISEQTKLRFLKDYDKYHDHYTQPATKSSLKFVLRKLKLSGDYINCLPFEVEELHKELNFTPLKNFRSISIYFDRYKIINDSNSMEINDFFMDRTDFAFYGGNIAVFLSKDVDYVFTSMDDVREELIRHFLKNEGNNHTKIITELP